MAFQDVGHLTERRKADKQRRLKQKIIAFTTTFVILLLLVGAGIFTYVWIKRHNASNKSKGASSSSHEVSKEVHSAIKLACSSTDFKGACETALTKAAKSSKSKFSQPKDVLRAAISVVAEEVDKVLSTSSAFKFEKPEEQKAFEDCKVLLRDAKEELGDSISHVDKDKGGISAGKKTSDLSNWLSAVMSYQETCVDGFPDGAFKSKMTNATKSAKELTSNALAIVSEVSSLLSMFQVPSGSSRRLLDTTSNHDDMKENDGLPGWMNHEERRMLRAGGPKGPTPNVIVAKDGSGSFKTISAALAAIPKNYQGRYVIYVKEGIYDETVMVTKKMVNITMYGDGSQKSIVTGRKNFVDGTSTYQTATFAALGDGFLCKSMGFRNTAGPEKHQAVALRVQADRSIFQNCRMEGYQDTLYAQTHRQYYRSCVIAGTVDFIFGDAAAVFQNCLIVARKPMDNQQNIVTAQGRVDKRESTGIVLQSCRIVADEKLKPALGTVKTYLGRPWKEFSRTIVMESEIGELIHPDGWLPWQGNFALNTLYYAEYKNKGPGSGTGARVKWSGYKSNISPKEAQGYTVGPFLQGDDWVKAAGVPVHFGLF